jgi:hypothetical protein
MDLEETEARYKCAGEVDRQIRRVQRQSGRVSENQQSLPRIGGMSDQ